MLSDEEKQTIDYLKARLYGNEGCKFIDVAQSDLRIFLKLVENLQKDIESWKKYCNEQENDITLKNNKICDLEFKIEKQSKEIEELKFKYQARKDRTQKEIERINEILIWKQKHEEQLQKEIERLNNKFEKIYNEIDNKNSQLVKALNYKLFMEDKIKAKIEEVDKDENASIPDFIEYAKEYAHEKLQSLLPKE